MPHRPELAVATLPATIPKSFLRTTSFSPSGSQEVSSSWCWIAALAQLGTSLA